MESCVIGTFALWLPPLMPVNRVERPIVSSQTISHGIMLRTLLSRALTCAFLLLLPGALHAQTLRGSPAAVDRMYQQALSHGLTFYRSGGDIENAHRRGELMKLTGNADYRLHDVSYPYVVPEAYTFVIRLASQYRAACGEELVVTSATRPTSMRLPNSVDKSVHPTGMAIDLRRPQNPSCLSWLRNTLLSLDASGVVEAIEERNPPHFHVAIFPSSYRQYVSNRSGPQVPTPVLATRATVSAPSGAERYEVRRGDSLWDIARRNNVSVDELRSANNIRGSRILAGQVLLIPR